MSTQPIVVDSSELQPASTGLVVDAHDLQAVPKDTRNGFQQYVDKAFAPQTSEERATHGKTMNGILDFGQAAGQALTAPVAHPLDTAKGLAHVASPDPGLKGLAESLLGPAGPTAVHTAQNVYADAKQNGLPHALGSVGGSLVAGEVGGDALRVAPPAFEAAASKVSPNVARMMNRYLNLQPSDVPKYERLNPDAIEEVGKTVYDHAGFKNNIDAQQAAIEDALKTKQGQQAGIIQNSAGQPIDVQHLLFDKAEGLKSELRNAEGETSRVGAVDSNLAAMHQHYGRTMSPAEALEMRNNLRGRITDWNPKTQNVEQRYLQDVYHGLNDEVANSLPKPAQEVWRDNNRTMNRLIIANDAAKEILRNKALGKTWNGPIKTIAKAGKIVSPSKYAENVPAGLDRRAAMIPADTMKAVAGGGRLAGDANLNRILSTPLLQGNQNDQQ